MLNLLAITNPVLPSSFLSLTGGANIGNIISAAVGILLIFGFIMALFHFIFGAFTWITASGDKNKLENAQDRITQALVGLVIMFAVWAVMTLLGGFLGISFPKLNIPSVSNPGSGTTSPDSGGNREIPTLPWNHPLCLEKPDSVLYNCAPKPAPSPTPECIKEQETCRTQEQNRCCPGLVCRGGECSK